MDDGFLVYGHHDYALEIRKRVPDTLYDEAAMALARDASKFALFSDHEGILSLVSHEMRLDLYVALKKKRNLRVLYDHMTDPNLFLPLLNVGQRRATLHQLFQHLIDYKGDAKMNEDLVSKITTQKCEFNLNNVNLNSFAKQMVLHLNFASFLMDAGWFEASEQILRWVLEPIKFFENESLNGIETDCLAMLLNSLSSICKFDDAGHLYSRMVSKTLKSQELSSILPNVPIFYSEFSNYCFHKSQFQMAYSWSLEAVRLLDKVQLPPKCTIDILRQSSQSCVVRRQFEKAGALIKEAVLLAKDIYGENHLKYADCLTDYGFYLLNVDSIAKSLQAYDKALEIRKESFGGDYNLKVAFSYEDLAYATYVKEYNTGRFKKAMVYAETSLKIMNKVLPHENHLLLASSRRVLALILEEIAIDTQDKNKSNDMLRKSENLHKSALKTSLNTFGLMNVQTAKHFGNLGRLYQSMQKFKEAEEMHLKAIEIKEKILGNDDYEVALSIGHLASLYNYDLKEYSEAERLYLKSVEIGITLFGEAYSGLEYDYRGLIRVYSETGDVTKLAEFSNKLEHWKVLRHEREQDESNLADSIGDKILAGQNRRKLNSIVSDVCKGEARMSVKDMKSNLILL